MSSDVTLHIILHTSSVDENTCKSDLKQGARAGVYTVSELTYLQHSFGYIGCMFSDIS